MKSITALIILCHFLTLTSCQKRSLIFVFDTAPSMADYLKFFKQGVNMVLDGLAANPNSPINNYVLVIFNDQDFGPVTVTYNLHHFKEIIQKMELYNSITDNCPSVTFSGIKLGLEESLPDSDIYLMSDASEKDSILLKELMALIQRRKCRIWMILSNFCGTESLKNYYTLSEISSGQVALLSDTKEVLEVMKFVNKSIHEDRVDIVHYTHLGGQKEHEIMVDKTITSMTVVVSGEECSMIVRDPNGKQVRDTSIIKETLNLKNIKAVDVKVNTTGLWTITYNSKNKNALKVTAESKVKIQYSFSVKGSTTIGNGTNDYPLLGFENSVLVAVIKGKKLVKSLTHVEGLSAAGTIYFNLTLTKLTDSKQDFTYTTEPYNITKSTFHLAICGTDLSGNQIRRFSVTGFHAQGPDKPYIKLAKKVTFRKNEKLTLICHVDSLIPVTVQWVKDQEVLIKRITLNQSGDVIYEINSADLSHEGLYECKAFNSHGFNTKSIIVTNHGNSLYQQFYVVYLFALIIYLTK